MVEAVDRVVQRVVDLGLHDLLGQRHLDLLEQRLEDLVADLLGLLHPLDAAHLLDERFLEFVDGVEFACQLGEVVVGLGQLALLDRLDGDGHLGVLAGVLTGGQLGGEGFGLALLEADDRVVEALDELTGADLVRQAFGGGLRQILAVDGGRQVDGDEVAFLRGGALDALRVPKRARSDCSSASTSSSVTSIASTVTVSSESSGSSISGGRMSTSAVKVRSSPYSFLVISISGWPSGWTSEVVTASL